MKLRQELPLGESYGGATERTLRASPVVANGPELPDQRLILSGLDGQGVRVLLYLDEVTADELLHLLRTSEKLRDIG